MKAVINDVSFQYRFPTKQSAVEAVHQWLDICKEISKKRVRRVQEIYGSRIDTSIEIAPDYKMIQLVQEFKDREERSRLLGVLLNSRAYAAEPDKEFSIDGHRSEAGAFAGADGILISLNSDSVFENETIHALCCQKPVEIDNLSKTEHIRIHSDKLGIRYYEHNKKHGKNAYIRAGGMTASEMDLTQETAQMVLDHAVEAGGHLYGYYEENYYEFRKTEKNTYHGYKNKNLTKEIKKKILELQNTDQKP